MKFIPFLRRYRIRHHIAASGHVRPPTNTSTSTVLELKDGLINVIRNDFLDMPSFGNGLLDLREDIYNKKKIF